MGVDAEFRLVVSPDLVTRGNWEILLQECPVATLTGSKGSVVPAVTRADLDMLRSRNGWPNPVGLQQIGKAVWRSILTAGAEAALAASRNQLAASHDGLRFVLVLQGQESEIVDPTKIQLSELPVEVLYSEVDQFLATDLTTPISRSFQWKPDRPPLRVVLPLRILIAIASPSDKPPADVAREEAVIRLALADLISARAVEVDFVAQATRETVAAQLKAKPYHVLHFVGHGGFDVVGDVDTPRAHLCFVRPDSDLSDPTDAETLSVMLKNSGVRLLVITACSSASPTPPVPGNLLDAGPLGTRAFDGVAQRAVAGVSGVTAAVAMQFDLEDVGATQFSKAFYENLLEPGLALDEVVTMARQALVVLFQLGHRAWVTPAVYWRCVGGKVFEIEPSMRPLDPAKLSELHGIDMQLSVYREHVAKIAAQPPDVRAAVNDLRLEWIADVEQLLAQRAGLFGESLRICGTRVAAGQEARCRLSLRVGNPGPIGLIQFRLEYPGDKVIFAGSEAGADVDIPPATAALGDGVLLVILANASSGRPWGGQEYELGFLRFTVPPTVDPSLVDFRLTASEVIRNGQPLAFTPVDGLLFIE
jgi:CHAT domain